MRKQDVSPPVTEAPSPQAPHVAPAEIYGRDGAPLKLLVGNGGAGALGLIRVLAEHFLASRVRDYAIGWVKVGTGENVELVRQGRIDMALTYDPITEKRLVREGFATGHQLLFHDRFILAGPARDPAGLDGLHGDIGDAFRRIADAGARPGSDVRYLTRDDLSATTVKERGLWALLQLDPWEDPEASWYVRFNSFPIEALERADAIAAYTLNDLGTWLASPGKRANMKLFRREGALLENPCSVIVTVPRGREPSPEALEFASYLAAPEAQRIIADFGRREHGEPLYAPCSAPRARPGGP
jgi:tungstate transport system substrate-binding protein